MNDAAGLLDVLPDTLHEGVAAHIVAVGSLVKQLPLHDPLRRNAGVVGAWQPQRRRAGHAPVADEGVL